MPEDEGCGHDHGVSPEHEEIMTLLVTGLQALDGEELMFFFRQMIAEMFIRTHPDDDFLEMFAYIADDVIEMFDPVTTQQPEILAAYTETRDEFVESVEGDDGLKFPVDTDAITDTALEASAGLADLFSEHGVLEEDAVYGNYL